MDVLPGFFWSTLCSTMFSRQTHYENVSKKHWALAEASADKNHSQPPRACMAYTSWSSLEAPPCTLTSGKPASVSPRIPMNCGPLSPFNLVKTRDVTLKTSTFTLIHGYFKGNLGIPSSVEKNDMSHGGRPVGCWRQHTLQHTVRPSYRHTLQNSLKKMEQRAGHCRFVK